MSERQRRPVGNVSVYLPDHLMIEILLRLESKSLIRFKCVCKSWNSLIRNPNFIAKHLLQNQNPNNRLLIKRRDKVSRRNSISLLSSEIPVESRDLEFDKIFENTDLDVNQLADDDMTILTCNDLLCLELSFRKEIFVWNPESVEFKVVPNCDIPLDPPNADRYYSHIGFGFDSKTNDYKVIRTINFLFDSWPGDDIVSCMQQSEVYSLQSDSWRKIVAVPHIYDIDDIEPNRKIYVNGVFYWYGTAEVGKVAVSFDMSTELFDVTALPHADSSFSESYSNFFSLNERLMLIQMLFMNTSALHKCSDIWVLLEHGVEASWTKLFHIDHLSRIEDPLGFWKNGELIMENQNGKLILYDPFSHERKKLDIDGGSTSCEILNYTESRVSIGEKPY